MYQSQNLKGREILPSSWVDSRVLATMSVTLGFLYFFAPGDAAERFYIFLDPQKCEDFFFKSGKPVFQC